MKSNRLLTGAIVAGAVAVASVFAAAPASAATLPSGQKITIIDQTNDQAYNASPVNADVTPVGTPTGLIDELVTGVDVDDDGLGYVISTLYTDTEPEDPEELPVPFADGASVYPFNANTGLIDGTAGVGVTVFLGDVTVDADYCGAIDYTAGVITLACIVDFGEGAFTTFVGAFDLESGLLFPFTEFSGEGFLYFASIATDPKSGQLYGFTIEEGDGVFFGAYTLSEDLGATFVTETVYPGLGADFDRDGQLWFTTIEQIFQGEFPVPYPALATVDLATGDSPFVALYTATGEPVDSSEALTVWGKPALAATGATVSPLAPAVAAAGILLLGSLLAAGTLVLRRRASEV